MSATNTLYRTIVGPVEPLRRNSDVPTPYRLSGSQQAAMNGPSPSGPSEDNSPITEDSELNPSLPS